MISDTGDFGAKCGALGFWELGVGIDADLFFDGNYCVSRSFRVS